MAALLSTTAAQVVAGDTVTMPCGGELEVATVLHRPSEGDVWLFHACGERWIVEADRKVGVAA